jgi:hypothetical protein
MEGRNERMEEITVIEIRAEVEKQGRNERKE